VLTRDERYAVLFLSALAAAGGLLRLWRAGPGEAPPPAVVAPHIRGDDIQAQAERVRRAVRLAQPLQPGETIDLDAAPADEIERLPGVGPALARRIIADREAGGPFGSLEGLDRVPGIGPATLRTLAPWVRFGRVDTRSYPRRISQ